MLSSHINPLITAGNGFSFGSLAQFVPVGPNTTKYQLALLDQCFSQVRMVALSEKFLCYDKCQPGVLII